MEYVVPRFSAGLLTFMGMHGSLVVTLLEEACHVRAPKGFGESFLPPDR